MEDIHRHHESLETLGVKLGDELHFFVMPQLLNKPWPHAPGLREARTGLRYELGLAIAAGHVPLEFIALHRSAGHQTGGCATFRRH